MLNLNNFLMFNLFKFQDSWKEFGLELDEQTAQQILEEAQKFGTDVLWPLNSSGDKEGCHYIDGKVITPKGYKQAYEQFCQAGWNAIDIDESLGGQNLPNSLTCALNEIFSSNNMAFSMYPGLTHGAFNVLYKFGSQDVHNVILPHMVSGNYSGTMCLTEAQCGSDLSLIKTKAAPLGQQMFGMQSYLISGTKIFISSGDHDLTENILHLVLAKTDIQAPGTKGISLFLVPKFKLTHGGESTQESNNVNCIGIEHKMGIKSSATAQLSFEQSIGYLIGEENKGLQYMFAMMNEARLMVGVQGLSLSSKAFELSLDYAKQRVAGKSLLPSKSHETHSLIVDHPDVRKMLMRQYVKIVAGKFLILWAAQQLDILKYSNNDSEKKKAHNAVALLTPIIKSFLTDQSVSNTNDAMQVFGGHGYLADYHVEQLYRDARITPIYEGTNTIQALDLLGRKIMGKQGPALLKMTQEIGEFLENIFTEDWIHYSQNILNVLDSLQKQAMPLMAKSMKNPAYLAAAAKDYLDLIGYVLYGYAWLRIVENPAADEQLKQGAHFYFNHEFPQVYALLEKIKNPLIGVEEFNF